MSDNRLFHHTEEQEAGTARWYAVRVRSNFEATTSAALREHGLATFSPTYKSTRQWSDRVKDVDVPLFPGYVFCRFEAAKSALVRSSPGVVHIVSAGTTPIAVDDAEVEAVRSICQSGLAVTPASPAALGQDMALVGGPLAGVEGTVIRFNEGHRLIASISLLQRAVSVELESAWIAPRKPSRSVRRRGAAAAGKAAS